MVFKRSFTLVFIGALIVFLSSCWKAKEKKEEKLTGLVLINVLERNQFDDCHIKGSIHVSFDKVKEEVPKRVAKDAEIVFYCSNYMCGASSAARKQLIDMGYKNVFVYEGGVAEWLEKGYPINGPCKEGYLRLKVPAPRKIEKEEKYILSAEQLKKKLEQNKKI